MREILFKGKRVDNGEWVYGFFNIVTKGQNGKLGNDYIITTFKKLDNEEIILTGTYSVIAETVGQFTGLTDKNGKKIFEGDIVKTQYKNSLEGGITTKLFSVYYKENSLAFAIKEINSINDMLLMFLCKDKFEEIGNVFDNPELIKE